MSERDRVFIVAVALMVAGFVRASVTASQFDNRLSVVLLSLGSIGLVLTSRLR